MSASRPAEPQWTPPLDADALVRLLDRVRAWDPLVVEAVFDDLDMAQGDQTPGADEVDELAERLRSTLKQLSAIAVADPKFPADTATLQLIDRGRSLRDEQMPRGYRPALGLARRLSWVTSDLIERLIATRQIKDAD
ncbi:DUF6415 family natural product biosynthesis protein [Streptomyces sp. NBC_01320]|uniref:DUF6415 family natural product biosynthesis protein n=1 Tax=Streptomyces sp. NBC_01320 TaxID=2903824 RepID=UPI002E112C5E|nr:DUF6415 family natural product biosynthesis protein [Streptomyces sp. NBC_01320]